MSHESTHGERGSDTWLDAWQAFAEQIPLVLAAQGLNRAEVEAEVEGFGQDWSDYDGMPPQQSAEAWVAGFIAEQNELSAEEGYDTLAVFRV